MLPVLARSCRYGRFGTAPATLKLVILIVDPMSEPIARCSSSRGVPFEREESTKNADMC